MQLVLKHFFKYFRLFKQTILLKIFWCNTYYHLVHKSQHINFFNNVFI